MLATLPNTQLEAAQTQQGRAKFVNSNSADLNVTPSGSFAKLVPRLSLLNRCNYIIAQTRHREKLIYSIKLHKATATWIVPSIKSAPSGNRFQQFMSPAMLTIQLVMNAASRGSSYGLDFRNLAAVTNGKTWKQSHIFPSALIKISRDKKYMFVDLNIASRCTFLHFLCYTT